MLPPAFYTLCLLLFYLLDELDKLIKRYSELYGSYKSAECITLMTVRLPNLNWELAYFNTVTHISKSNIFSETVMEYLNKLKKDTYWKNVNGLSELYADYLDYSLRAQAPFRRKYLDDIVPKSRFKKSKNDLTPGSSRSP
uniref:Uncharacterized protein n=1 Tax=Trichobilharzia regenti TaxID=157069 RepID=A0AA85IUX8_TRIRE|nr:unnamed protein product [Trichobilharzia regenti]